MSKMQESLFSAKKETLADSIHNQIIEFIIKENISQDSVFNEGRLVQQFNVSKATVREALVRLCNENILMSIPRFGYVVVHMGLKELKDICTFRQLIEEHSLNESFDEITSNLTTIEELLIRHEKTKDDSVWDVWQKNMEFHELLVSFSQNQIYIECLRRVMRRQVLYFAQNRWQSQQTFKDLIDSEPHTTIYDALKNKDLKRAQEALLKDIFILM